MSTNNNLIPRITDLLNSYYVASERRYDPTYDGVSAIVSEWKRNKADLIAAFQNHPNYDGDYKIVLNETMYRNTDSLEVTAFGDWVWIMSNPFHGGTKVIILDGSTANNYDYGWVDEMNMLVGKEMTIEHLSYIGKSAYMRESNFAFDLRYLKPVCDSETELMNQEQRFFFRDRFERLSKFITDDDQLYDINKTFPFVKAHKGAKTSRVINKICKYFGLDKLPEYNSRFARFADAINPLEIKRWTVLSVNPIDYLTMSFGNTWASCHTIDKTNIRGIDGKHYDGLYSGGTLSYMLDSTSIVMYTVDGSYRGNDYELQPKIQRQMFHFGKEKLIQGRLYPLDQEDNELQDTQECKDMYEQFRTIAQRVISECFGFDNLWTNRKGKDKCRKVTITRGSHYRDYLEYPNCNVSYLKREDGTKNEEAMKIGAQGICPQCGEYHEESESILCSCCYNDGEPIVYCSSCGDAICRSDAIAIGDDYYCDRECAEDAGFVYCDNDGEYHDINSSDVIFDDYERCYLYDRYGYWEDAITTEDGHHFCNEINARRAGYIETDDGEWYPEDEVYECSICGRAVHESYFNEEFGCCNDCVQEKTEETA